MKELLTEAKHARADKVAAPNSIFWKLESDTRFRMRQSEEKPFRAVCFEEDYAVNGPTKGSEAEARRYFLLVVLLLVTSVFTYLASTGQIKL